MKRYILAAVFFLMGGGSLALAILGGGATWLLVIAGVLGILVGLGQLFVAMKKKPPQ